MRELFNQDRPASPSAIRGGVGLTTILLAGAALVSILLSVISAFSTGAFPIALLQVLLIAGLFLFAVMVLRILSEIMFAVQRSNDRLTVLGDDLKAREAPAAAPTRKRAAPKPAAKTPAEPDS